MGKVGGEKMKNTIEHSGKVGNNYCDNVGKNNWTLLGMFGKDNGWERKQLIINVESGDKRER